MIQQRKFCFWGRQGDRLVTNARWESENQSNGNISGRLINIVNIIVSRLLLNTLIKLVIIGTL